MAITRSYQPPVALVGEVARLAGQGQFEQERDKFLAQQAQFYSQQAQQQAQFGARMQAAQAQAAMQAQRDAMQTAATQERFLMGLAADQQKMLFQAGQNQLENEQRMDFQREMAGVDQQNRVSMEQMRQQADMARQQAAVQAEADQQSRSQQFDYDMEQLGDVNSQVNDLVEDVRGRKLDPEMGQKTAAQMMKDIQAVRNQQSKLTPGQFSQAMGKVLEKYGAMDWDSMTVQEPTPEEQFQREGFEIGGKGSGVYMVRDGRGGWRREDLNDVGKPNPAFLGFKDQESLNTAVQDLIKNTTRKTVGGERPTLTSVTAYDELRRLQRIQMIDPEIAALEEKIKSGELDMPTAAAGVAAGVSAAAGVAGIPTAAAMAPTGMTRGAAEAQLKQLRNERDKLVKESAALLQEEPIPGQPAAEDQPAGEAPATPKAPEPERVRAKMLPGGETVDMKVPAAVSPDLAKKVGGKFDAFSGLDKNKPIVLSPQVTPEELMLFSGRWVQYQDEDGNIRMAKIGGDMYDLDEVASQLWPEPKPEDVQVPGLRTGI